MTPPTRGFRLLRDAVLSLSRTQEFVRPLYHWRTSRPHEYTHSALNSQGDDNGLFTAGLADGAPPRNVLLGTGDYLLDHVGCAFDLLYFMSGEAIPAELAAAIDEWRRDDLPLRVTAIVPEGHAGGATGGVAGADQALVDAGNRVRQAYGVRFDGGAYLLRPDQHVCARWVTLDPSRLRAAMQTALQKRQTREGTQ